VRLKGWAETVSAVANRPDEVLAPPPVVEADASDPLAPPDDEPLPTSSTASTKMTRAMWQAMKLPERVQQSGIMTPQEIAEALDISVSHARNLIRGVESGTQKVDGRSGVSYLDLIDSLYVQRNKNSYTWARKLETTLGARKRARPMHIVTGDELSEEEVASGSDGD
jgi:hypothetical protein